MSPSPQPPSSHLTPREYVRVWWAIAWRNSLFGLVAGSMIGVFIGIILMASGYARFSAAAGTLVGGIANIVISYFVTRSVLAKPFDGFRLVVDRRADGVS